MGGLEGKQPSPDPSFWLTGVDKEGLRPSLCYIGGSCWRLRRQHDPPIFFSEGGTAAPSPHAGKRYLPL